MTVPAEIRAVPRPINTVVIKTGKPGPYEYSVKERKKPVYRKGQTPSPRNGATIGHIFNGKFVPKSKPVTASEPESLSYGPSALLYSVSSDIFEDLCQCFNLKDSCLIMTIAMLRVIRPKIPNGRLQSRYSRDFISVYYPNMTLSKNKVGDFLEGLGASISRQQGFFKSRLQRVAVTDHIAIDGTLKQNTSMVNDLSAFSRKARVKGCKDISILYAYNIETMEPLCCEVFPGNCIDATAYHQFVTNNGITKGIIVADKGFPSSKISQHLKQNKNLHFLTPVKRNDARIRKYEMTKFTGVLDGIQTEVYYKKQQLSQGQYLYAFKDAHTAALEDYSFARRARANSDFDSDNYQEKKDCFGVIVFESDLDLPALTVYQCYEDRWLLEIVFNRYKNYEGLDQTRVQGDFSVYGNEFINFIATVLTTRIVRKAEKSGLLKKMSYYDLMDELSSAWRKKDLTNKPKANDLRWVHTNKKVMELLVALDLAQEEPNTTVKQKTNKAEKIKDTGPKRPRGRPRIKPILVGPPRPPRPRGRPRKNSL